MLTPEYLADCTDGIVNLYQELEESIVNDMARRITRIGMSETTVYQMERLQETGALYEDVIRRIAGVSGQTEAELAKLFQDAGTRTLQYDDEIYRAVGLNPLPLSQSPAMLDVLLAGVRKTSGIVQNLTLTTAISTQTAFTQALDLAYMQVSTGTMSYTQAITRAVKQLADDGVSVIHYASGHRDKVDVAVRRAVLTGVNQTAAELQLGRAAAMGAKLVEVTAHVGARTGSGAGNHAEWQGKVYSLK